MGGSGSGGGSRSAAMLPPAASKSVTRSNTSSRSRTAEKVTCPTVISTRCMYRSYPTPPAQAEGLETFLSCTYTITCGMDFPSVLGMRCCSLGVAAIRDPGPERAGSILSKP